MSLPSEVICSSHYSQNKTSTYTYKVLIPTLLFINCSFAVFHLFTEYAKISTIFQMFAFHFQDYRKYAYNLKILKFARVGHSKHIPSHLVSLCTSKTINLCKRHPFQILKALCNFSKEKEKMRNCDEGNKRVRILTAHKAWEALKGVHSTRKYSFIADFAPFPNAVYQFPRATVSNTEPQSGQLKQQESLSQLWSLKSGCWQGWFLSRVGRKNPFHILSQLSVVGWQFLWLTGGSPQPCLYFHVCISLCPNVLS